MLSFLPAPVLGVFTLSLCILNLTFHFLIMLVLGTIKLIPISINQLVCTKLLIWFGHRWVDVNSLIFWLTQRIEYDIEGLDTLPTDKPWLLVFSNHRTWVDIVVLQTVYNHQIPFLKFFIKQELRKVPLLGFCWWALDFPFMQRHSKAFLEKHPEMKGKDIETTRQACEIFKRTPVSVINFLEGTRLTEDKRKEQNSPYKNLLIPKAGGVAVVISEMADYLSGIVDTTLLYEPNEVSFSDLMSGKVKKVVVHVQYREVPVGLVPKNYNGDLESRQKIQGWLNGIWEEKDVLIDHLIKEKF
ncbi:MAG: 1-acyl-sn-glycerol-3-phosphate acyltransferase [bacterium]|jgi:1-acyl-sn-glycerol-3-phosphate acyltransferase